MNNDQQHKGATQQMMPSDMYPDIPKNKMNVLRVIDSMNPNTGGPCQGVRNSIPAMQSLGIISEVVCLDDPDADFFKQTSDNFTIHALGPVTNPWHYSQKLMLWLLENLPRFDVVIVHGLWLYPSYAVYKATQRLKDSHKNNLPAWFLMPHGMLDPYFQKAKGRRLKAIRNIIYWRLIESKVVNNANALLFTCAEEMRLASTSFSNYHPKKVYNAGYGIAAPPAYTKEMQDAFLKKSIGVNGKNYLLFLSRIQEKKGVDILVKAYEAILTEENKNDIPCLVIAGPGLNDQYGKNIAKYVDASAILKSKVFFTGMLTGDSKWGAYYGCDAFVLPSHQENFGIAVVEALACGKPVLISDKINIWREIEGEDAGIICADSIGDFIKVLNSWFSLPKEEKIKMCEGATYTFKQKFEMRKSSLNLAEVLTTYSNSIKNF